MSDFTGLAVISFLFVMGLFCFFYVTRLANDLAAQIVTGVADGNPIPIRQRWLLLYQAWLPHAAGAAGSAIILAAAQVELAEHVGDAEVKRIAYMAAFVGAIGALAWAVNGVSMFLYYRSVLRAAHPD
jgi:hypothetical protein